MPFSLKEFQDNINPSEFARPSLFEVLFHNLGPDCDVMKYMCCSVFHFITNETHQVEFEFYEREDNFVSERLMLMQGAVTILEYSQTGKYTSIKYDFRFESATTKLSWDMGNEVKKWSVTGFLKK
jgi:hypothetical protein